MLQGGPGLAKRLAVRRAPSADDPKSVYGDAEVATLAIPLNIAPLLMPFKKSGPFALRIERLHHLARLSKGRNNGNGTWSLAAEDVEGVNYLLPAIVTQAHTLAVRVVGLSGSTGETIALLDLVVSPSTSRVAAPEMIDAAKAMASRAGPRDETNARQLQEKLQRVQAELAERELEIESLYEDVARSGTKGDEKRVETELAAARAVWKRELDERLMAAATELRRNRQAWEVEQEERRVAAEAEAEERLAEARQRWQRETDAAMLKAEEKWRAETSAKLDAAREHWKVLEARLRSETEEEIRRLRDERSNLQSDISSRETALVQSRATLDQAREEWRRESEAVLAKAKAEWQAEADAQLRAAEERWRIQSEKALADANARRSEVEREKEELRRVADTAVTEGQESSARELRVAREENARLRSDLDARNSELGQAQTAIEQAREEWRRASDAALAKAKTEWQEETNAQLAAVEARWREQAKLKDDTQSRILLREARVEWLRESEAAMAKARAEWQAEADTQLGAAEARWRAQSEKALAEANARRAEAERTAEEFRRQAEAALTEGQESSAQELQTAREENARLRNDLDTRSSELRQEREAMERAREEWRRSSDAALANAKAEWQAESNAQLAAMEARWREQSGQVLGDAETRAKAAETALADLRREKEIALNEARENSERALRQAEEERAKLQSALKVQKAEAAVAQDELKREAEAAMAQAKAQWQADMRAQFTLAEEKWKKRSAEKISEATQRYQSAESALAKLESETESLDIALMRNDVVPLKSLRNPVGEDSEDNPNQALDIFGRDAPPAKSDMSDMDSAFQEFYAAAGIEGKIVLRGNRQWRADETQVLAAVKVEKKSGFMRDAIVAVVLAASVVIAFPFIKEHLPRGWQRDIDQVIGEMETSLGMPPAIPQPAPEPVQPATPTTVVSEPVNFRTSPSTDGGVITTLQRGVTVVPLETNGEWVHVRIDDADGAGNPQDGWVYSSYLTQTDAAPPPSLPDAN